MDSVFTSIIILEIYLLFRIKRVSDYRLELLRRISEKNHEELNNTTGSEEVLVVFKKGIERMNRFDEVSFNKMVFQPWKTVESFYNEEDLLS